MPSRVSVLDAQMRALGATMGEWNDMAVVFRYPSDPHLEHDAIRDAVGVWDTSALTKIRVRGADALAAVDYLVTRDMTKIPPGKAGYCPILKDDGHFCDDGYIYCLPEDESLVMSSIGPAYELLKEIGRGREVSIERDEDLHVITVQGPKSVELLDAHINSDLYELAFCHFINTSIFGQAAMISRTGYSGERGYEVYLSAESAVPVWQGLLHYGQSLGARPVGFDGLEMVHIESGLMAYGAEATEENTPWEVGFGWAVSRRKGDFRGKEALFALQGKEKIKLYGIVADHPEVVEHGATLSINGESVGHVTTPAYSRRLEKSLALVHLIPSAAAPGTELELRGPTVQCAATATPIPFVDPERKRLRAI